MGLLDTIFGRKKNKNIRVEQDEENPNHVRVYAKVSDGTSQGISTEELSKLTTEAYEILESQTDLGKMSVYSNNLLSAKAYDEMIAFNHQIIEKYPNTNAVGNSYNFIGVACFFKKDYPNAIYYYIKAMENGMDVFMMDNNIWEATEIIYKESKNKAVLEDYLHYFPEGEYSNKAKKLLK